MVRALTISDVSRIHFQGGSILRTSRTPITDRAEDLESTLHTLLSMGINYLVLIGGDGTAQAGSELARVAGRRIRIAQIPKTIDNDLPLPGGMPTFGYETARHTGTHLVLNLMEDSRTTNRWYFVVVMWHAAGHLALGIGKAAGATLTVIPEEWSGGMGFPGHRLHGPGRRHAEAAHNGPKIRARYHCRRGCLPVGPSGPG